jgi:Zn-dependent protease with chaperone function
MRREKIRMKKRSLRVRSLAVALILCFSVATLIAATGSPELPDPGRTSISKEQQEQLGMQAAAEVYKQMPVLPDASPETQYVRKIGQRLVSVIPQQYNWPYEFHVVQQKEINAFALPGGQMFVNIGTITAADNEAQLAGVMAHEMSHVYMQHSAKQMEKASVTQGIAGLLGAVLGGTNSVWGGLARAGIQFGAGTLMMKYSRGDEAQADAVGAIILYKAGYSPMAMANFFQKLAAQGGNGPQFLSDHPNPGNREAAIQKEIAPWPQKNFTTNTASFQKVKQLAASVKVYDSQQIAAGAKSGQWAQQNQKSGAVLKNAPPTSGQNENGNNAPITNVSLPQVQPSGNFKSLNLDSLKIEYPENWQVMQDQQQSSVTIAPQAGVSGNAIAYGVVINGASPPNGQQMNIDQITSEVVKSIIQGNGSGTKQVGNPQPINVNGVSGRSVELLSTSPIQGPNGQQLRERDWVVTVPRGDGSAVFFVFVAPEPDFDHLRPTYESMLKSLRLQ